MSDQSNLNRNINTSSYVGNASNAEGEVPNTLDFKNARQVVNDRDLHADGTYDAASQVKSNDGTLLGQGTVENSLMTDPDRPNLANPAFPGAGGTTNAGQQGIAVDFNSVGRLKDGQFPRDSYTSKGPSAAVPLT